MATANSQARTRELESLLKRDHTLHGGVVVGLDGYIIDIQARAVEVLRKPVPWRSAVKVSGMPSGTVREAIDRISGAFRKYEIEEPQVEILINLAPADLLKDGTWMDLPLAIIMLQAAGMLPDLSEASERSFVLMGEVGLHGELRRVPGVLSIAYIATPGQSLVVPAGNEKECALIMAKPGHEGCKVAPAATLKEVIDYFKGQHKLKNILSQGVKFQPHLTDAVDIGRIRGQEKAKEAALIAAAGGHNLLLIGPPGEGKSLLASSLPGILPRLTNPEMVELTRIYSACGELKEDGLVVSRRPMRSVHHSASKQAILGGGSKVPRPGEITLAHLGVLFLDEIAEFNASTLDSLRQPIENGSVSISRVMASIEYPCQFTLVAAMNPCPCGYYGSDRCRCSEREVKKYQSKISGPILDRIDLQVDIKPLTTDERFKDGEGESSKKYLARVERTRETQRKRFEGTSIPYNAAIPGGHVRDFCAFSDEGFGYYKTKVDENAMSTRSMDRLAKVSRTVADLYNSEKVERLHVDKAAEFVIGGSLRGAF